MKLNITNRQYENLELISFDVFVPSEVNGQETEQKVSFEKLDERLWCVNCVIVRHDNYLLGKTYTQYYEVPKVNMSLDVIAGMGLKAIQMLLKQDIQNMTIIDFSIGEVLNDV